MPSARSSLLRVICDDGFALAIVLGAVTLAFVTAFAIVIIARAIESLVS